jgi:hypothetical protein
VRSDVSGDGEKKQIPRSARDPPSEHYERDTAKATKNSKGRETGIQDDHFKKKENYQRNFPDE